VEAVKRARRGASFRFARVFVPGWLREPKLVTMRA